MIRIAHITIEAGHTWWRCPNCAQKLGEIIGDRVVIKAGPIMVSLGKHADPDQTCHRCGTVSALREECAA